jgi:hypothetical protein
MLSPCSLPFFLAGEWLRAGFPSAEEWRLALALVHWADKPWSEIVGYLDAYYKQIAEKIVASRESPILRVGDSIFLRRWAEVILTGQNSRSFTVAERKLLRDMLIELTQNSGAEGHITTDEARSIIGLGNSQSETVQEPAFHSL